jgi:transcriptional regulator with XRE-family HTH domain
MVASAYFTPMDDKWFKSQQKRIGITADQIAGVLGRDRSVVSKILAGKQRMTLDWANAFARALDVPLATVLEKAGVADGQIVQRIQPGFAESDAVAWIAAPGVAEGPPMRSVAQALGADRPGVDIWRVKSQAMALAGMLAGDFMLIDTHQAERVRAGDLVVAQVYDRTGGATTLLRRYEPPVLVAASTDPGEGRVHVVDGVNVVIRGKVMASWRASE